MQVISTSPLRLGSLVWQPWPRVWAQSIICKATFLLAPGTLQLADVQEDLFGNDRFCADDPQRSLYAPSDLVPVKPRADVILVGHAFAPKGRPVRSLVARLAVGDIDKRIEVWCDRIFWHHGQVLEGQPFIKMPLWYERAAGGPGTWNPVGMRHDAVHDAHGAVRIPNLQAAGTVAHPGQPMTPIGFGPIAPLWPGRYEKSAGLAGQPWHERILPQKLDNDYFNAAPWDQQIPGIRPDERIILENLHSAHETLETRLPGIVPRAIVRGPAREGAEHVPLVADTLWIDTDRGIATLIWRGRIGLRDPAETGTVVVGIAGIGESEWPTSNLGQDAGETLMVNANLAPALPFDTVTNDPASHPLATTHVLQPVAPHKPSGTLAMAAAPGRTPLPFQSPMAQASPFLPRVSLGNVSPLISTSLDITLPPCASTSQIPLLPFDPSATPQLPPRIVLPRIAKNDWSEQTLLPQTTDLAPSAWPFQSDTHNQFPSPAPYEPPAPHAPPAPDEPPALHEPPVPMAPIPSVTLPPSERSNVGNELLSVHDYAVILSELSRGSRKKVLAKHGFDHATWRRQERLQAEALECEALAGKTARASELMTVLKQA